MRRFLLGIALACLPIGVLFGTPIASAGTSCDAVLNSSTPSTCTFVCFAGDTLTVSVTTGVFQEANSLKVTPIPITPEVVVEGEANCGGATLLCRADSWGPIPQCESSTPASSEGVGTCTVYILASYDLGEAGADAMCSALSTRDTAAACVQNADLSQPGSGGAVAQYIGTDPCTDAYWLLKMPGAEPVQTAYAENFPGCERPKCNLSAIAYAPMQIDPTVAKSPVPVPAAAMSPSTACDPDGTCYVAEMATGQLTGWDGTATIQCSPGTEGITPDQTTGAPAQCARSGFNVGPVSTGMTYPRIRFVPPVPFGDCTPWSFRQDVTAFLRNPAGDTYNEAFSVNSPTTQVCYAKESTQAQPVGLSTQLPPAGI